MEALEVMGSFLVHKRCPELTRFPLQTFPGMKLFLEVLSMEKITTF